MNNPNYTDQQREHASDIKELVFLASDLAIRNHDGDAEIAMTIARCLPLLGWPLMGADIIKQIQDRQSAPLSEDESRHESWRNEHAAAEHVGGVIIQNHSRGPLQPSPDQSQ